MEAQTTCRQQTHSSVNAIQGSPFREHRDGSKTLTYIYAFSELLAEKVDSTENSTIKRIKNFQEAVISSAKQTVPRTKPGKKTKSYLTPVIKSLIKQRNNIRKQHKQRMIRTRRQEWVETCRNVRQENEME